MAINALGGYTTTTYQYNPGLDPAYKQMQAVAGQYAPGGKIEKAMTKAQESALQQGKRKSISNMAQQLVSAGLANTTNLPSAELGYEAEVMAPARTQLSAQLAQQYANMLMQMAQYTGQRETGAEQMQYEAAQSALQRAAQYGGGGGGGTPFMGSAAGGGGGGGYGGSLTGGLNYPGGGETTTGGETTGGGVSTSQTGFGAKIGDTVETSQGTLRWNGSSWVATGKIESALRYAPGYGYGVGVAPVPTYSLLGEQGGGGGTFKGAGYTGTW
jgi:hypothetical protein